MRIALLFLIMLTLYFIDCHTDAYGDSASNARIGACGKSKSVRIGISGIDVSHWQGHIRFEELPQSVKYAFIKATEGTRGTDPNYSTNLQSARLASLAVGSYHYFIAGESAADQFRHFAAYATIRPGDLPPVVDIESLHNQSDEKLASELKRFLTMLETQYTVKPIIYSGRDFANKHLAGLSIYPLWLAEYTDSTSPELPLDWNRWTFWQSSQSGSIKGIQGCVDLDSFNGNSEQFRELLVRHTTVRKEPDEPK